MSAPVVRAVLDRHVGSAARKAVLLILAEHAHRDGTHAFPSVGTIVAETELRPSTVRQALSDLRGGTEKRPMPRLIVATKPAGRYRPTEYRIRLRALDKLPPALQQPEASERPDLQQVEVMPPASGGHASSRRRAGLQQPEVEPSTEPPEEPRHEPPHTRPDGRARTDHDRIRKSLAERFAERTSLQIPEPKTEAQRREAGSSWWAPLREVGELVRWREEDGLALVDAALGRLTKAGLTITSPRSIIKTARAIVAEVKRGAYRPEGEARGIADLRAYLAAQPQEVADAH